MVGKKDEGKIGDKLDKLFEAIEKLTRKITNLESKFSTFEGQLKSIDDKYSEKCSNLEAEISALELNITKIGSLATEIEINISSKIEDIDDKVMVNATLLQKIANLEKENIMRESYDKCLNLLVHGLKETENETKQQTKTTFENFLS